MPSKSSVLSWKTTTTLCKPNVVAEMLFTAVVGMLLAVPGMPPLGPFIYGTVGIALAASSAAAMNHFIDRKRMHLCAALKNAPTHRRIKHDQCHYFFNCVRRKLDALVDFIS